MTADPTLYIVTAYQFNHVERPMPIDARFFAPGLNSVFYFVDESGGPKDFSRPCVNEIDLNPAISAAGRTHLAEWTFLLTEYEKPFATYPFYVASSRFHEKNLRLPDGLAPVWGRSIEALRRYGWGYLPSYDRDTGFEDLAAYWDKGFLAMTERGLDVVEQQYGVRYLRDYRWISDFFCNYVGFASRRHLERYVEFYLPFLRRFFNADYSIAIDGNAFCRQLGAYRNEKPFTFLLEMISHLFFYKKRLRFAGVGYDGVYEVDERAVRMRRLGDRDFAPGGRLLGPLFAPPGAWKGAPAASQPPPDV